jgi:hypothetical protein
MREGGNVRVVCDSSPTFAYDCERRLAGAFKLRVVELFDFEPAAESAKIVGVFDRNSV